MMLTSRLNTFQNHIKPFQDVSKAKKSGKIPVKALIKHKRQKSLLNRQEALIL